MNTDKIFRSTDQSANMTLKTNRELTNEIVSTKKSISDANSENFTRKKAQAMISIIINCNPTIKIDNFDITGSKLKCQINYEYHHWEANRKVMDTINKRTKSPETLRLMEMRQEITKPRNLRLKFDSNINRKIRVPSQPKKTKERRSGRNRFRTVVQKGRKETVGWSLF